MRIGPNPGVMVPMMVESSVAFAHGTKTTKSMGGWKNTGAQGAQRSPYTGRSALLLLLLILNAPPEAFTIGKLCPALASSTARSVRRPRTCEVQSTYKGDLSLSTDEILTIPV